MERPGCFGVSVFCQVETQEDDALSGVGFGEGQGDGVGLGILPLGGFPLGNAVFAQQQIRRQRCWGLVREGCKGFFEGRFGDRYRVFNGDQSVVLEGEDFLDCIRQPGDFYGTDDPRMVLAQGRIQIGSGNLRGTPDFLRGHVEFYGFWGQGGAAGINGIGKEAAGALGRTGREENAEAAEDDEKAAEPAKGVPMERLHLNSSNRGKRSTGVVLYRITIAYGRRKVKGRAGCSGKALGIGEDDDSRVLWCYPARHFRGRGVLSVPLWYKPGGFVCGQLTAKRAEIRDAALLRPCDIGRLPQIAQEDLAAYGIIRNVLNESAGWLTGTSGEALLQETFDHSAEFAMENLREELKSKPILCIGGTLDIYTPPQTHCVPFAQAIQRAGKTAFQEIDFPTDHFFADYRLTAAETVIAFLEKQLPE